MYPASTFFLHHLGSVCVLIDPQGYLQLQANAVSLASGLPHIDGGNNCVLYPSSAKAGSDLQVMLVQNRVHTLMCNCTCDQTLFHQLCISFTMCAGQQLCLFMNITWAIADLLQFVAYTS